MEVKHDSSIFNVYSPEMYINMKPGDIPPPKHPDRVAFLLNEKEKCKKGITINGVFIPPSLYYDLNFHAIQLDSDDEADTGRIITKPTLRDNGWLFHNEYWEANLEKEIYLIGGARQIGKSDLIVSLTCRELFCSDNAEVMGLFSISADKQTFNKKLQIAMSDLTNPLVIPAIDKDLGKTEVRFGLTRKNNEPIILSRLYTYLTQEGKATEVGAGKSVTFFFFDEIAKEEMQAAFDAVIPAAESQVTGLFRSSPLLAFTGGNVEKSADAINLFMNPKSSRVKIFTTEGLETGRFMGGWYKGAFKKPQSLASYLNRTEEGELADMIIHATDFQFANQELDKREALARDNKNPNVLAKHKMYNPRTLEEMSLSSTESPFSKFREGMKKHQDFLRKNQVGIPVKLFRTPDGKVHQQIISAKPIANFPHKIGEDVLDAPIMIYDAPRYNYSYKLHIAGLDPYNIGMSDSVSLGAFYLMRRAVGNLEDPYQDTIVCSYVARLDRVGDFLDKLHMILDFYNGTVLHENNTDAVLLFFDKKHLAEKYLVKAWGLKQEIAPNSSARNEYGAPVSTTYQKAYLERTIDYCSEIIGVNEQGGPIYGYTRIPDPMLLEELIQIKIDSTGKIIGNYDRYVAFGHVLLYKGYLEKYHKAKAELEEQKEEVQQDYKRTGYGLGTRQSSGLSLSKKQPYGFK